MQLSKRSDRYILPEWFDSANFREFSTDDDAADHLFTAPQSARQRRTGPNHSACRLK